MINMCFNNWRKYEGNHKNDQCTIWSTCFEGCILGSLISGLALAITVTLWLLQPRQISSSITMTTTTVTIPPLVRLTAPGDFIVGIYNTGTGQSTGGYGGISPSSEGVTNVIDGLISTKYLNYGSRGLGSSPMAIDYPGVNTGFIVTPKVNSSSVACGLLFAAANDFPERDPMTVSLEGSHAIDVASLNNGTSWTLIYNGSTGMNLQSIPPRSTYVAQQNFSNTIPYRSYRLLVTSQRGKANAVQYAEALIVGYFV